MLNRNVFALFLLSVLAQAVFPEPACRVFTEFPLTYPGSSIEMNVSYDGFLFPSPIVVVCRPNSPRFCYAAPGSGSCTVPCDYPYQGTYTVIASSFFSSCKPFLMVVDPGAKPTCVLTPFPDRGNGSLTTRLTARFSNLLPNVSVVAIDCGNGLPASKVSVVGRSAQTECHYSAEDRKESFIASASGGGGSCSADISVIPASDSSPPRVSFHNITYRMGVRNAINISINATDNSEIDRVELYLNRSLVLTMHSAPYSYFFNLKNYAPGTEFLLEARAYDIYGNSNSTPPYIITKMIEETRSCNITANPLYSPIPAAITLTAVFYNISSDVVFAYFKSHYPYTDINVSSPMTQILNRTARTTLGYGSPGTYSPYVTDGNTTCTTKIYITATPDTTPPAVSINSPTNNQDIRIGDSIELAASASDNVLVTGVEYYLGDRLIANSTSSPFNATWNTSNEHIGFYYVSAIARDVAGNPSTIPSKVQVILSTNRTCTITPQSAVLLSKIPVNFSVSCFNFTRTNFSQAVTNRTASNFTENFTISSQEILKTIMTKISCPDMEWSSSLFWSDIAPRTSPPGITFTPQETATELPGTISATDPVSGFSCSSEILVVKEISACSVKLESPILVGANVPVTVYYENLTKPQEFRITCRPNVMAGCFALPEKSSCTTYCDYPSTGRFFVAASSPSLTCASKKIVVLPHPDIFPPVVSITRPFNRQILSGVYKVEAYATDNFGVSRIEFLVDSEIARSDEFPPYVFDFNTSKVRNGDHSIAARAYDETGNSMDYMVTVTVAN